MINCLPISRSVNWLYCQSTNTWFYILSSVHACIIQCYTVLCCLPVGNVYIYGFLDTVCLLCRGKKAVDPAWSADVWHPLQHYRDQLNWLSPETGPLQKKKKKKIDIFSHKLQLQSQAGRHKSNVYFKGGKKNSSGFPPMSLWALGLSVTRFIDSIEYCNRNIQFFHSSDDVRGAASWSQRRMTKTMECGSFDRKSLFAEVLRQHCSRRCQVLMSPSDCWVKYLWEITAD